MSDWNAVTAFMNAVVPWPEDFKDPGYVNLHYSMVNPKPTPDKPLLKGMGWPFRSVDQFVNRASWIESTAQFKDVWFCTSLQRKIGQNTKGKPNAKRSALDALALKAIWVDIDVGPDDPQKYATIQEALKAVIVFYEQVGLPAPSAVVCSGSGLHVYWISDIALPPATWAEFATGLRAKLTETRLKCDAGLTTDSARILRVPGTFNHKTNPPKPVTLLNFPLVAYNFETQLSSLKSAVPAKNNSSTLHSVYADGAQPFSKPAAAFAGLKPDGTLQAGIDKHADRLLDGRPIFKQCNFLRNALKTGGEDYANPLWNLSLLCATFMENGNAVAHKISKRHPTYTADDTQEQFDRKMAERRDRGLGYPSCATIAANDCKACASCPLLGKIKSPLNIRPPVTATVTPAREDRSQAEVSFADPYAEFVGPEFPLDILPPTLANFVNAEHRAMGADPAAIAMAALTVVAGAMHAETQLRAGDSWWEKPILWTALLGQPSSMKSPIIDKAKKPLSRIDHDRRKRWRQLHKSWELITKTKTTPAPPPPPMPARCMINDVTPEKVADLLSREPSGSLMVQDELASWLGSFERYTTGQAGRAFYLSAWNGGSFLKDRVGKGAKDFDAEICVDNLALSILGGIQPDLLAKLGDLTSDGLLQRFLSVLMKAAKSADPDYPVTGAEADYESLVKLIADLPAKNYRFSDEACEVRDRVISYLQRLETVDGFSTALLGAIGKLKGYFVRICLVLHVAFTHDPLIAPYPPCNFVFPEAFRVLDTRESLAGGIDINGAIRRDTAEAAEKLIGEFLLPHMIGLYDVVTNGGQDREQLRNIAGFILASDKDRLRPSDLTTGFRALRGQPEHKIREWAGRFCSLGWLIPEDTDKPGPPKAWLVCTGLRGHFAEQRKQAQAARAEMHAILKAGGSRKRAI